MDDEDNIVVTDDDDSEDNAELEDDIDTDGDDDESLDDEQTLTFKVENGRIRGKVDEQEAMIQAIDKILRTERLVFPIYSDQYGNDFNDLIGKNMAFAKVEVERMLKEALLADERVIDLKLDEVMQTANDTLVIRGICITVFGDINIDSEVSLDES
ncbi:DUF2634 domain-containing protein [Lactobacillus bombicola]|uniref:DUF2634 domain-containing protein n=1 Tax=Lactobacillus bombicola TaxID=1505723 RepID=A0ABX9LWW3_9LACO|nr:DUF2634 domain-containing protein [Lactobacillus bombicola]RHW48998.1 DUF2634 domain-containing protein [Lactobacillus bombicola]RHW53557.1 DUF2634 domain-containing protein [Lactobacillus bombicola]